MCPANDGIIPYLTCLLLNSLRFLVFKNRICLHGETQSELKNTGPISSCYSRCLRFRRTLL